MAVGLTRADVMAWSGRMLRDPDGKRVGRLRDVFYDSRSGAPAWALVRVGRLSGGESVVPVARLEPVDDRTMRSPWSRRHVADAPRTEVHGSLSHQEEELLCAYYGICREEIERATLR